MFSILIPTWNNLPYLKLCVESIRKTARYPHEIIVHVNEGHDGTLDWVRSQGLKHSYSPQNLGVCLSVNHLAAQASNDWLVYMNDDMVCCPGWDTALVRAIESAGTDLGLFFSTLIEPVDTGNPLVIFRDFGTTPETFRESELYAECQADPRGDRDGLTGQPTVVHRRWWHLVGGYSIEFGPGMSSDDDLMMKLWVVGARLFRTVGASRIYHFSRASTGKVRRNRGGRTFVMKWGLTQHQFTRKLLPKAGQPGFDGATSDNLTSFPAATFKGWTRRVYYGLKDYPLGDLRAWDPAPASHLANSPSINTKKTDPND
jgi:GT2 family glycosyltransferase